MKSNPNASFIRADIQDSSEFLAFVHHPKNIIEESFFRVSDSFNPHISNSEIFTDSVVEALKGTQKGVTKVI